MNHRKISALLLAAGAIAIAGVLWIFGWAVPTAADRCQRLFSGVAWLYWPALLYVWVVGVLMLCAIIQYMRICLRIGRDRSFCKANIAGLRSIARLLFAASAMCLAALAAVFLPNMAPGPWCAFVILPAMASGAMASLAMALSWLLARATQLQEDSELTI